MLVFEKISYFMSIWRLEVVELHYYGWCINTSTMIYPLREYLFAIIQVLLVYLNILWSCWKWWFSAWICQFRNAVSWFFTKSLFEKRFFFPRECLDITVLIYYAYWFSCFLWHSYFHKHEKCVDLSEILSSWFWSWPIAFVVFLCFTFWWCQRGRKCRHDI